MSLESGQISAPRRYSIIPNEIVLEIFSYIQIPVKSYPTERAEIISQLSRLSLACKFFCTTLRPHLFRRLALNQRSDSPSVAFCQAIVRSDVHALALAVHVRNCEISHWSCGDRSPGAAGVPTMTHHWALQWVPNIECLKLSDSSDIDSGFWRIIGGLSKLKTLKLSFVSFQDDIPDEEIDHVAGLQVSSLSILDSQVFSLPQVLNPAMLAKLDCDPDCLDILLDADGSVDTLETLTISYPELSDTVTEISMWSLKTILSKVPSLRNLTTHCGFFVEGPEVTPQDFSALLPNLRSLTCSLPLLEFLVPSGPLVSLQVMDDLETSPPDLSTILGFHGLNTVTQLDIPSTIYLTNSQCFPHLHSLHLRLLPSIGEFETPGPEATAKLMTSIVDFCDQWAVSLTIRQLHISTYARFPLMDLALQHTMLCGALSQKFPVLLSFQLTYGVEWERSAVDEAWRVSILTWNQEEVIALFKAGDPCVVDYDGYLQRLSAQRGLSD